MLSDYNQGFIDLSVKYAGMYEDDPKNFIGCFFRFGLIRESCDQIVRAYKRTKIFEECKGDFSEWVSKQDLSERWKEVLNGILKIIYSLTCKE